MKLTRKQKSAINKAAFRAGTYSRVSGCALPPGYSKPTKTKAQKASAVPSRFRLDGEQFALRKRPNGWYVEAVDLAAEAGPFPTAEQAKANAGTLL